MKAVKRVFERFKRNLVTVNEMQCRLMPGMQADGGCVVHGENVAGELWEEETDAVHVL